MIKKGTKLYSILKFKCPSCHQGDFFVDNNPLHLKNLSKMHKNCSNCNIRYELEPSFFHGAMYVSYGLTVGFSIMIFIICFLIGINLIYSSIAILILLVLMMPLTFKLSRIIYINFFVDYKGNKDT
jgi:uncharacterized protein (DUF983 family)